MLESRAMTQEIEGYTRFGWYLEELMSRKHIRGQRDLARILTEGGYPIKQPAISKMMRGESETKSSFNGALAEILEMDDREQQELAFMAAIVQADKRRLSWENMRRIKEIEEEAELEAEGEERESGDRKDRGS